MADLQAVGKIAVCTGAVYFIARSVAGATQIQTPFDRLYDTREPVMRAIHLGIFAAGGVMLARNFGVRVSAPLGVRLPSL